MTNWRAGSASYWVLEEGCRNVHCTTLLYTTLHYTTLHSPHSPHKDVCCRLTIYRLRDTTLLDLWPHTQHTSVPSGRRSRPGPRLPGPRPGQLARAGRHTAGQRPHWSSANTAHTVNRSTHHHGRLPLSTLPTARAQMRSAIHALLCGTVRGCPGFRGFRGGRTPTHHSVCPARRVFAVASSVRLVCWCLRRGLPNAVSRPCDSVNSHVLIKLSSSMFKHV